MRRKDIHCGACMEEFPSIVELIDHLNTCVFARVLKLQAIKCFNPQPGHQNAHYLNLIPRHSKIIQKYAWAVSNDIPILTRAKIHIKMCDQLGIPYEQLRPFESEAITSIPTQEEAEEIILYAIFEYCNRR